MKVLKILAIAIVAVTISACDLDTEEPIIIIQNNIYDNCCNLPPIERNFNPGKVYMANMFTPNFDGINDIFFIQTDDGIKEIVEFKIFDKDDNMVFEAFSFFPNQISSTGAWLPDDDMENGLYRFFAKVKNTNEEVFELDGAFCAFVCDENNPFEFTDSCGFPIQHNGEGEFDQNLPNEEPDCP